MCFSICSYVEKKGKDLIQSFYKSPYINRNAKKAKWQHKLEAQGPFIAHLITNSKQFSQKKEQNDRIQINACVIGNTSLCCYEHFVWKRISRKKAFLYLFLPRPGSTLGISSQNSYQNGSIPSKAFCLWSSLWLLRVMPLIQPRADLIKSLNTCAGHENFSPTKFHKHPSSGSVVKADYVCSHKYICISAPPPLPSPK